MKIKFVLDMTLCHRTINSRCFESTTFLQTLGNDKQWCMLHTRSSMVKVHGSFLYLPF